MKKVSLGIIAALLVFALAVPAFAATLSDSNKKEINDLYTQMSDLRKQIVQKYVDAGVLTKTQGNQMKENIDNSTKYQEQNSANPGYAPGYGCGGGYGGGYGMMGGYNNSGYYSNSNGTVGDASQTI